ncbi:MAG TPA: hypothetical protein VJM49_19030 [Acidimicrobiales bacterium]|nr:hypothetical protein [Acidimicrobiales bacterium]
MRTTRPPLGRALAALALAAAGLLAGAVPSGADENPDARGPAPTEAALVAPRGPLAVRQTSVTGSSDLGFNRGTISYPADGAQTYGGIVAMPGFVSPEAWIAWTGPYLASNGFVVMTLEPFSGFDDPGSLAAQIDAALDYLTDRSPSAVRSRLDPHRLGVVGQSTGATATAEVAVSGRQPDVRAIVRLQPWATTDGDRDTGVPTMQVDVATSPGPGEDVVGGRTAAAPLERASVEIAAGSRVVGIGFHPDQARATLVWLKRWVDADSRYGPFVCPGPAGGGTTSSYQATCPV